jgi:hypothetical protein
VCSTIPYAVQEFQADIEAVAEEIPHAVQEFQVDIEVIAEKITGDMLRDTTRGSSTATHDVEGSHIEHAFA